MMRCHTETFFFLLLSAFLAFPHPARAQSSPDCPETANPDTVAQPAAAPAAALESMPGRREPPQQLSSPFVVKGHPAYDETSTVWIEATDGASYLCSGTIVGADRILTAAHCVCPGCKMSVGFGPNSNVDAATGRITSKVVGRSLHPQYRPDGSSMQPGYDLAVLTIEDYSSCSAYKKAVPIYPVAGVFQSSEFLIVGYGLTETGAHGEKRKAGVFMASRTCTQPWAQRAGCINFEEFILEGSRQAVMNHPLGADTCNGDSGGPAFVIGPDGKRFLAGVTSRALIPRGGFNDKGCGFGGIYEFVGIPSVLGWLKSVVPDLRVAVN